MAFNVVVVYPKTFWYQWRARIGLWRTRPWYTLHLRS
jgi:hypothetical protein